MARARRRAGTGTLGATATLAASYLVARSAQVAPIDDAARRMMDRAHRPHVDRVVAAGTDLGSVYGLAGVVAGLVFRRQSRAAVDVAVSGLAAWTAAQAAKPLIERARPYELGTADRLVSPPAGSSWPSGHAAVAGAMACSLAGRMSPRGRAAVAITAAAVGMSRLYVGVHHFSDVAAGWGIGALCATATRAVRSRMTVRRR